MNYLYQLLLPLTFLCCSPSPQSGKLLPHFSSSSRSKIEVPVKSRLGLYLEKQGLVNIHDLDPSIIVDLKYATTDNFTSKVLYTDLNEAYLHPMAAYKLAKAQALLKAYNPSLSLLVYDAARPLSVQRTMYEQVQNTKYHLYVANPSRTGLHNYGVAVDLTICDADTIALDMGTKFDYFGKEAGTDKEDLLLAQGLLSRSHIENRKLLRKVMREAGFIPIKGEWWHFNACSLSEAKNTTNKIE